VNVTDDFSHVDPTITKGQMTLRGEQAIRFVRTRRDVGDQLNISRIDRQKEYIGSFLKKFRSRYHSDLEFAATTYDQVLPYIVTDCSLNTITSLMDRYGDYEIREVVSPAGENVMGEEYYEFYADEDALDELILRLFYAPKE
jgi:anionic cell wall polymer biosynthesis LytR-Cps2A-Psr (LCP) family protein